MAGMQSADRIAAEMWKEEALTLEFTSIRRKKSRGWCG